MAYKPTLPKSLGVGAEKIAVAVTPNPDLVDDFTGHAISASAESDQPVIVAVLLPDRESNGPRNFAIAGSSTGVLENQSWPIVPEPGAQAVAHVPHTGSGVEVAAPVAYEVIWPVDLHDVPAPASRWRRLEDGRLEAVYTRDELALAFEVIKSILGEGQSPSDSGAELSGRLDAWDAADDPHDPKWARMWAEAAIQAGLPCYPDGRQDAGAEGWRVWLAEALGESVG